MADFQQHQAEFAEQDARVVAISSDREEDADWTVRELGLGFPLGHGLDAEAAALTIGCYTGTHEGCAHVQPSAFVLDAEGTVLHAVYSSGKVGRLTASDALLILKERRKAELASSR